MHDVTVVDVEDVKTGNVDGSDPVALGAYISQRRIHLDLTKSEAARRAGVSRRTWHEIEDGQRVRSSPQTLALFDQALQLPEGTLYAMTRRSADHRVETLRQRAINLVKLMSTDELNVFVDSGGHETIPQQIAQLQLEVRALRREQGAPPERRAPPPGRRAPSGT